MKTNAPIGIFDSGLGGLTVFEEIRALLPHENLIYIADSAYAPYGNKSDVFIIERSLRLSHFLFQAHGIKALVVACNTATAAAVATLRQSFDIPVIGMEPGIKPAIDITNTGVIGVLATENTLKSEKFSTLLDAHHHRAHILTQPCHGLVEAIERGDLETAATKELLASYLVPLLEAGADTIVLGCTHYPLLTPIIRQVAGEHIQLVRTGGAVAKHLKSQLEITAINQTHSASGTELFYTSGEVNYIQTLATSLLQRHVHIQSLPPELLPEVAMATSETTIIEFELEAKHQLMFQAMLQGEDGLAFVRCVNGVQQLWTTSTQVSALYDWLQCLPETFNLRILRQYVWEHEAV